MSFKTSLLSQIEKSLLLPILCITTISDVTLWYNHLFGVKQQFCCLIRHNYHFPFLPILHTHQILLCHPQLLRHASKNLNVVHYTWKNEVIFCICITNFVNSFSSKTFLFNFASKGNVLNWCAIFTMKILVISKILLNNMRIE